jgi:hypothetical protein
MTRTMADSASAQQKARRIPLSSAARKPLQNNVFDLMAGATRQLLPLFPYHDAGSIVPCGGIVNGDADE